MIVPPRESAGPRVVGPNRNEALLAYRAWSIRLNKDGYPHLESCSIYGEDHWRPGDNRAKHRDFSLDHAVPVWECVCGYWAVRSLDEVPEALKRSGLMATAHVIGSVYLTGKIIRHELGFRAERAQVGGLLVPEEMTEERLQHLQQIAVDYGVPLVTDPRFLGG